MHRYPDYTRTRIRQLTERLAGQMYRARQPLDELLVAGPTGRISPAEAAGLTYRPAQLGEQFGPNWATFWFKLRARVPAEWAGGRVDLWWISHSEATLWVNGRSVQGLNWEAGQRADAILLRQARGGETLDLVVEMACNRKFGIPGPGPQTTISPFVLDKAELALFDPQAWELYYDLVVLSELEADAHREKAGMDPTWAGELLAELNRFANTLDEDDRATWPAAHGILKDLLRRTNAPVCHELSAIGHAHIDTAWLWPLAETWRKCERTFSTATAYMEDYPEYKFSCSQAYQYDIIKARNPDLYARIKAKVQAGQWVPVGGTWIEPDCNIPSGEALVRQFCYGQRFFEQEFGLRCREFWNPDVFGYNGQLPQIMKLAGIHRFLTQKLSWNRFNKPHHHTFTWQGIDGSEVLAHFPPADTYNAVANIRELRQNARDYKDHDRSRHSLMLFGFGDGGGGPTKTMLETLRRVRDLQGVPRTTIRSSDEFFALLEQDCIDRPLMVGELYFEYHRGTYTSQALVKKHNRQCEIALHDAEFLAALAERRGGPAYPAGELDELWKVLLLNQFHDILPGSSITEVYADAARQLGDVLARADALRTAAAAAVVGPAGGGWSPLNTTAFRRHELAQRPDGTLAVVEAGPYGVGHVIPAADAVTATEVDDTVVLENAHLRAVLGTDGRLLSLIEKSARREVLAAPGNVLELYDDRPTAFDAWDVDPYHLETGKACPAAERCTVTAGPLRAEVAFERRIGAASRATQVVRLDAHARRLEVHCTADWHEAHKLLKVAFPVNVRNMTATYEMQFGVAERPTHFNTTYDLARYEVPGHRFADLSEHGFGVALLTDCKYGYSTFGNTMRISLLRAPKHPDPQADMGAHAFAYAIYPHVGGWQEGGVVAEAARFNLPLRWAPGTAKAQSFFGTDTPHLVLDTVKKAHDGDGLVLRLYEAHGSRGVARVAVHVPFTSAAYCNGLEEAGPAAVVRDGQIELSYRPFEIISLRVR